MKTVLKAIVAIIVIAAIGFGAFTIDTKNQAEEAAQCQAMMQEQILDKLYQSIGKMNHWQNGRIRIIPKHTKTRHLNLVPRSFISDYGRILDNRKIFPPRCCRSKDSSRCQFRRFPAGKYFPVPRDQLTALASALSLRISCI